MTINTYVLDNKKVYFFLLLELKHFRSLTRFLYKTLQ